MYIANRHVLGRVKLVRVGTVREMSPFQLLVRFGSLQPSLAGALAAFPKGNLGFDEQASTTDSDDGCSVKKSGYNPESQGYVSPSESRYLTLQGAAYDST